MTQVDTAGWEEVGSSSAYVFYAVRPDVLAQVPREGLRDTPEIAREALAWQDAYWRRRGHTGCVAVFVDLAADQDPEARRVYEEETEDALTHAAAMIAGTFWGRTVGKAFIEVGDHRVPIGLFATIEDAMPWFEEMNQKHKRTL